MEALSNLLPQAAPSALTVSASTPAAELPPLPDSPDLIRLTEAQTQEVANRLKKVKWGQLYRAFRAWELLNCELVWVVADGEPADSERGTWVSVRRASCTTEPPYLPARVFDVELTQQELDEGLKLKQESVFGDLQFQHRLAEAEGTTARQLASAPIITSRLVAEQAYNRACRLMPPPPPTWLGPAYRLDDDSEPIFWLLAHYFAGSARFVTLGQELGFPGLTLDKGLALFGNVGVGKTLMLRAYQHNPLRPYGLVSARHVAAAYKGVGEEQRGAQAQRQALYEGATLKALCIDDVGTEEGRVLAFGNASGPFAEVLQSRYDRAQAGHLPRWATHLSTNYALEPTDETRAKGVATVFDLYGERVVSRIYELCNVLILSGPDRRA